MMTGPRREVPARALRTLATYLLLTGKARLIFRDLHSEALRDAERAFRDLHPSRLARAR